VDTDKLYYCVSRRFTKNHLLHEETKTTLCGLKWRRGGKGQVWIPTAVFFNALANCRRCFNKKHGTLKMKLPTRRGIF
jgi:hypothetical protein